jgi:hypothetical protein
VSESSQSDFVNGLLTGCRSRYRALPAISLPGPMPISGRARPRLSWAASFSMPIIESHPYPIGRDAAIRAMSNRDFGRFLGRVFGTE